MASKAVCEKLYSGGPKKMLQLKEPIQNTEAYDNYDAQNHIADETGQSHINIPFYLFNITKDYGNNISCLMLCNKIKVKGQKLREKIILTRFKAELAMISEAKFTIKLKRLSQRASQRRAQSI